MDILRIRGGHRLEGSVAISGAKNAALPVMAAAILNDKPVRLRNVPQLTDVESMSGILRMHGVVCEATADNELTIDASRADPKETPYSEVRRMRASILVLGPILGRFGKATISLPGGCAIGDRPVDMHISVLASLGAQVDIQNGMISARAPGGLTGTRIVLSLPSVGATETAMMAATMASGETEILNAAREPEIVDLARALIGMGAEIEGAGTHRIRIEGRRPWRDASHTLMPDRVEAGTYAMAAAITGGQLELVSAELQHMGTVCEILESTGCRIWPGERGLIVEGSSELHSVNITTEPYPGFPSDLQAQFMALMTQARGESQLRETIFERRFMHVPELVRLGASIALDATTARVRGTPGQLQGADVMATDLRASACLVLAALAAKGTTTISRVYHLDRGYEALDRKLRRCGADIERMGGGTP